MSPPLKTPVFGGGERVVTVSYSTKQIAWELKKLLAYEKAFIFLEENVF